MIFNNKIEQKLGLRIYSGGHSSGTSNQQSSSSSTSTGRSTSSSAPQMTPQQLLSLYGAALPTIGNAVNTTASSGISAPALQAANKGAVEGVNAINMNGLSPGETNAVERSLNQTKSTTGNLGLINPTNTVSDAMNFGGAFNSKIPLLNAATQTASGVADAGSNAMNTAAGFMNPLAANATAQRSTSNSLMSSAGGSSGTGNSQQGSTNVGLCFLTTACCKYKGLPDNCEELETLRAFRDTYVPKELVDAYYKIAPAIVEKIKDKPAILKYIYGVVRTCVIAIKSGHNDEALFNYINMVETLEAI